MLHTQLLLFLLPRATVIIIIVILVNKHNATEQNWIATSTTRPYIVLVPWMFGRPRFLGFLGVWKRRVWKTWVHETWDMRPNVPAQAILILHPL